MSKKTTRKNQVALEKSTSRSPNSSENMKSIWMFDKIDRSGDFAFNLSRIDHKEFLEKLIDYSNMTWREIRQQTHDSRLMMTVSQSTIS